MPSSIHRPVRGWTTTALLLQLLLVVFVSSLNETSTNYGRLPSSSSTTTATQPLVVIGILSQPDKTDQYHYIAKAYVDWVEESGAARVIPIPYDAPPELLDDLFDQINGVLLPGGWNGYMPPSVPYLLDKVLDSNQRGHYFPVWGICLGYEFLIKYIGGESAIQEGFDSYNTSLALEGVSDRSRLYADPTIRATVVNRAVTMNNHKLGIEPQHFYRNAKLTKVWNIMSTNHDANGRPFVSTIEPIDPERFPLYGVQYHPEKNGFEYTNLPGTSIPYEAIDHSDEGVAFSIHLSRFFLNLVERGRQTNLYHSYDKPDIYPMIEDYPLQTGIKLERVYVIPDASHWETLPPTTRNRGGTINNDARAYLQMLISTSAV